MSIRRVVSQFLYWTNSFIVNRVIHCWFSLHYAWARQYWCWITIISVGKGWIDPILKQMSDSYAYGEHTIGKESLCALIKYGLAHCPMLSLSHSGKGGTPSLRDLSKWKATLLMLMYYFSRQGMIKLYFKVEEWLICIRRAHHRIEIALCSD